MGPTTFARLKPSRPISASDLLAVALAAVLAHALVRFAVKAWLYLRSPYSRDYGEGAVLAMVQLLDERGTCFMDMRGYPYVHVEYPPVFPAVVWPFYRWLGPTLWVPRLVSILATLGILAAVYGLARRLGHSRGLAAAIAGVALCPWFLQGWAPRARVDMLAIFFTLAGLCAFLRGWRLWAVFALFWLAFFTKQNALLAPAAVLLSLLRPRPTRRFALATAGFVLPLAALCALLVAATHGEAYRQLVTYTAAADMQWSRAGEAYGEVARVAWPLLVVVAFVLARRGRAVIGSQVLVVLLYWALAVLALASFAKDGAVQNYFIEPWLATVLAAAALLPAITGPRATVARLGALVLAAAVAHYTSNWGHLLPRAISNPDADEGFRRLWQVVAETDGPILSENLAVLVLHRKPVLVEPFGVLTLSRAGLLRTGPIVRDCEAGVFRLVVVEGVLELLPGMRECLARAYPLAEELPPYRVLRPSAASSRTARE
jgi:4-amino-4-deoxy-L-arabinose transferase-like glycosyltransferase